MLVLGSISSLMYSGYRRLVVDRRIHRSSTNVYKHGLSRLERLLISRSRVIMTCVRAAAVIDWYALFLLFILGFGSPYCFDGETRNDRVSADKLPEYLAFHGVSKCGQNGMAMIIPLSIPQILSGFDECTSFGLWSQISELSFTAAFLSPRRPTCSAGAGRRSWRRP